MRPKRGSRYEPRQVSSPTARQPKAITKCVIFCSLSKILKCAANDDKVTMKAGYDDDVDKIKLVFEASSKCYFSQYLLDEFA